MAKSHKRIERLLLFSKVAEHLSFSKAADELDISRSYLSQQISQVESELKTQLLIRSTRKVRLTTEGQKVLRQMLDINRTLLDIERDLSHSDQSVSGVLRITAPAFFGSAYLMQICNSFRQQYPQVEFEIDVGNHLEDLAKRNYDLAIRVTEQPPENMIARQLTCYEHWICASDEYLARAGIPEQPADLRHHQCLSHPDWRNWVLHRIVKGHDEVSDIATHGGFAVNDYGVLVEACLAGNGLVRAPQHLLEPHVAAGRLQRLFQNYQIESRHVWLVYPQRIEHSTRMKLFIAHLLAQFESSPT
ncbi:LysR family transcriptional regulator [Neiella marina]|uniref:LysR family transcriptional regulator n=1 Tax=Neiella holothuriorum TaxID=2870530 RepID=A0ABS7ECB9_9GAMM|nr:LysR family transcriptional regulator [Neiella holothuriorum]MBW8189608.1 LysR family transcriptional regulator [Neiella holothuriorum]